MKPRPRSKPYAIRQVLDDWLAKSGLGKRLDVSQVVDRWAEIVGPGKLLEKEPTCPALGEYEFLERIPAPETPVVTCSKADAEQHVPKDFTGW